MSQIRMETDNVRAMSSGMRQSADFLDASLSSIIQTVKSAEWRSQAREEFLVQLIIASKSTSQAINTLRLMANALDEKANQWEVIGNKFNGPFYHIRGIWASVTNSLGDAWTRINNILNKSKMPSVPGFLVYSASGAAVLGASTSLIDKPEIRRPSWWPFEVVENEEIVTDRLENLEMQREYTYNALEEKRADYKKYSTKVSEIGQKMSETDVWKPLKNLVKSLGYDIEEEEPKFENMIKFMATFATKRELVLVDFISNLGLSTFQATKLFFQLDQMRNAYQKSQLISAEISNLTNQINIIDNQITTYGGN